MQMSLPQNEAERLQALLDYAILDTGAEQAFDEIAKLTALICSTPIALLTFIDRDHQWFKSRVGFELTQIPRQHAFCAQTILEPEHFLVVADASLDSRFSDLPLVTQAPAIRYYAGVSLQTPAGDAVGTLCVMDCKPRQSSVEQMDALRMLSRVTIAHLEQRSLIAEVERNAVDLRRRVLQLAEDKSLLEGQKAGLEALSITDGLTGLKNRRGFDTALSEEIARASRDKTPLSLLMLDIDNFKSFNDAFGHPAGDQALTQAARILAARARPFDRVARYGGEEFAVILPNTEAYSAVKAGERLRRAVEDASWPHRDITVSIGADTWSDGMDGTTLTSRADRALYWVKQSGRNYVAHARQHFRSL